MLTYRKYLTRPLTADEVDENFKLLNDSIKNEKKLVDYFNNSTNHLVNVPLTHGNGDSVTVDILSFELNTAHQVSGTLECFIYQTYLDGYVDRGDMFMVDFEVIAGVVTISGAPTVSMFLFHHDPITNICTLKHNSAPMADFSNFCYVTRLYSYITTFLPVDNTPIYS